MQVFICLKRKYRFFHKQGVLYAPIFAIFLIYSSSLEAQKTYEWEIDRIEKREQEEKVILDSLMVHLKNKWEIKIGYGIKTFQRRSRSLLDEPFFFPRSMGIGQLTGVWHMSEKIGLDITMGFQLGRDIQQPDVFSVLNGGDLSIEGSGGLFFPLEIGGKYYFMQNRFRPYTGISLGSVLARSLYTRAEGNISTGIERTDFQLQDRVGLVSLRMGFDYRLNKHMQGSLLIAQYVSGKFNVPIGGYRDYSGLLLNLGLSLIPY